MLAESERVGLTMVVAYCWLTLTGECFINPPSPHLAGSKSSVPSVLALLTVALVALCHTAWSLPVGDLISAARDSMPPGKNALMEFWMPTWHRCIVMRPGVCKLLETYATGCDDVLVTGIQCDAAGEDLCEH